MIPDWKYKFATECLACCGKQGSRPSLVQKFELVKWFTHNGPGVIFETDT